jgi:hypothetical protein
MAQSQADSCTWQALIDGHLLESVDPQDWLSYGVALLQTIIPGPGAAKQQQQAALAFVQAQQHGASPESIVEAQRLSVMLSLWNALDLAKIPVADQRPKTDLYLWNREQPLMSNNLDVAHSDDPMQVTLSAMAEALHLELHEDTPLLDQLLAAKMQLRNLQVSASAVRDILENAIPADCQARDEVLQKLLLVLL